MIESPCIGVCTVVDNKCIKEFKVVNAAAKIVMNSTFVIQLGYPSFIHIGIILSIWEFLFVHYFVQIQGILMLKL